jgi:translation initiation factor RLI1
VLCLGVPADIYIIDEPLLHILTRSNVLLLPK